MRATRWVIAVLLGLQVTAMADPAPDPERQAIEAYKAKDYAAFLTAMRLVEARDPGVPRVLYNLASAEALGGSPDAAVKLLRRLASTGLSFAIEKDDDFQGLGKRADFQAVVRTMKQNLAPRGKADPAFTLGEAELLTEGVAYDPDSKTFFVSSVRHRKIVAIDAQGAQRDFTPEARDGIGGVFGISVDRTRRVLWATSIRVPQMIGYRPEDKGVTGVFAYELATGKLIATHLLPQDGKPHALGEVIVAANGDAYASDSATPTVYRIAAATGKLEVFLEGGFASLQGMALSADNKRLYVADYARGLFAIDVATKAVTRLAPPAGSATTGIDGLYLHRGRLVATQNGTEPRRVLELKLDRGGTKLVSQQVVLSGDPRTHDLSLGVVVGDALYLNAAAGWDHYNRDGTANDSVAAPHVILRVPLPR
jgi:hypothetical protein